MANTKYMTRIEVKDPEAVAKRAFFLAWQACGGPTGMGFLQDRGGATEDQVWKNVQTRGDYPGKPDAPKDGEAYGDYVFGRMMKLRLCWDSDAVYAPDLTPRADYQVWCRKYQTYAELITAAATEPQVPKREPAQAQPGKPRPKR